MSTMSRSTVAMPKLPARMVPLASLLWAAGMSDTRQAKPRVLVIDDEGAACELASLYLEHKGLEVATVRTADEARPLVERGQFDVVVVDWELDGGAGLDLLQLSKTRHPDIPVILVTAANTGEAAFKSGLAGTADAVVRKMGPLDALSKEVFRCVSRRHGQPPDAA